MIANISNLLRIALFQKNMLAKRIKILSVETFFDNGNSSQDIKYLRDLIQCTML